MAESKDLKRGDKMADETKRTSEERKYNPNPTAQTTKSKADTKGETTQENKDALARVVESQSLTGGQLPSQADSDLAVEALFSEEKEKDGVKTVVTSISEEEALKALKANHPEVVNLRASLDGVPGLLNLTAGGTLNTDGTKRINKTVEEMNAIYEDIAGPNPMPNRVGNELTLAANVLTTSIASHQVMENRELSEQLSVVIQKTSNEEDKKVLERAKSALIY